MLWLSDRFWQLVFCFMTGVGVGRLTPTLSDHSWIWAGIILNGVLAIFLTLKIEYERIVGGDDY